MNNDNYNKNCDDENKIILKKSCTKLNNVPALVVGCCSISLAFYLNFFVKALTKFPNHLKFMK